MSIAIVQRLNQRRGCFWTCVGVENVTNDVRVKCIQYKEKQILVLSFFHLMEDVEDSPIASSVPGCSSARRPNLRVNVLCGLDKTEYLEKEENAL